MINRDELLKMAEASGAVVGIWRGTADKVEEIVFYPEDLNVFANAILERAAVECESQADRFMQGSPLEGNKPYASHECAAAIRALKTK